MNNVISSWCALRLKGLDMRVWTFYDGLDLESYARQNELFLLFLDPRHQRVVYLLLLAVAALQYLVNWLDYLFAFLLRAHVQYRNMLVHVKVIILKILYLMGDFPIFLVPRIQLPLLCDGGPSLPICACDRINWKWIDVIIDRIVVLFFLKQKNNLVIRMC